MKRHLESALRAGTMAVVVAGVLLSACENNEDAAPEAAEEAEERTEVKDRLELSPAALESIHLVYAKAEERELSPSLQVPAEIMPIPDQHATVGPRVAGRVIEVRVNVGDHVEAGDALVLLESDEVGRARADLIAARARAEVARRRAERQRGLLEDSITSQRAVEEAEGALRVAEADLQAARTRLRTFGVSAKSGSAKNPARVVLTSPLAGTVTARSAHIGQWVAPAATLIEVVNLDRLWVVARVYEREMRHVSVEQPVQVEVRAFPGEVFPARIDRVGATLDERTRSARLRIVIPNEDHRLRPGMFATARIQAMHAHEPRRMLAIPWAAIQEIDAHPSVFVRVAPNAFELRRVHTGERAGDYVEILNGLSAGDEVVAEGSFLLKGQLLRSTLAEEE